MLKPLHRGTAAMLLLSSSGGAWWAVVNRALSLTELPSAPDPADHVVTGAAAILLVAVSWLLLLLVVEITRALTAPTRARRSRPPLPAQAAVAALVALALGSAAPATASADRLPAPDRIAALQPSVLVRPGDTLWAIAETHMQGGDGTPLSVLRSVRRLHRANAETVGADPDHIQPGTRLRLPTPRREETR